MKKWKNKKGRHGRPTTGKKIDFGLLSVVENQRTLKQMYIAFSHASDLCVWFLGGFCLTVQVDTVRVELFR